MKYMPNRDLDAVEVERLNDPFYIKFLDLLIMPPLFLLFFFVFFIRDLPDEYSIVNVWYKKTDVANEYEHDSVISVKGEFAINYVSRNERFVHYFNSDGSTRFFTNLSREEFAACGYSNFVLYRKQGVRKIDHLVRFFDRDGNERWQYDTYNYPQMSARGSMIALHSSENMTFRFLDANMNASARGYEAGDYIVDSAFARDTDDFIASYINGNVMYVYRTGEIGFSSATLPSKRNIAKAAGISERGSFVAVLSGIDPEYLSVYSSDGKLQWYTKTGLSRRKRVDVYLNEKENLLVFLRDYGIAFRKLDSGKIIEYLSFDGYGMEYASYMKADVREKIALLAFSKNGETQVTLFDIKKGKPLWEKRINEHVYNVAISSEGNEFLIVTPSTIYCYARTLL